MATWPHGGDAGAEQRGGQQGLEQPPGAHAVPGGDLRHRVVATPSTHSRDPHLLECYKRRMNIIQTTFSSSPEKEEKKKSDRKAARKYFTVEHRKSVKLKLTRDTHGISRISKLPLKFEQVTLKFDR